MAANYTTDVLFMPIERELLLTLLASDAFDYASPFWREFGGTFSPIPQLKSNSSDLVVAIIVKRGTLFLDPVDDPLFSAHKVFKQRMTSNETDASYLSDLPASAFACQYQIVYYNSAEIGTDHLTAANLVDGYNTKLPDDQWLRDFLSLENNIRTQMQIALAGYATGFRALDMEAEPTMRRNQTEAERKLCGLQRMQSPGGFVNINVFALAFVVTFCVIMPGSKTEHSNSSGVLTRLKVKAHGSILTEKYPPLQMTLSWQLCLWNPSLFTFILNTHTIAMILLI
ncbi:hypothetical protein N0V90_010575 [Kalmusia sp. IMI 367209]|nr:hypothetical protein N0V90_010575 [Kalmusia sp. IMI 367209]